MRYSQPFLIAAVLITLGVFSVSSAGCGGPGSSAPSLPGMPGDEVTMREPVSEPGHNPRHVWGYWELRFDADRHCEVVPVRRARTAWR
jgi:hypothetical protein